jgi:hypothetical protein
MSRYSSPTSPQPSLFQRDVGLVLQTRPPYNQTPATPARVHGRTGSLYPKKARVRATRALVGGWCGEGGQLRGAVSCRERPSTVARTVRPAHRVRCQVKVRLPRGNLAAGGAMKATHTRSKPLRLTSTPRARVISHPPSSPLASSHMALAPSPPPPSPGSCTMYHCVYSAPPCLPRARS